MKKNLMTAVSVCLLIGGCGWIGKTAKFSGTLEMTEFNLGSPVPGRLEKVLVREGDAVKQNQLLATFDRYAQAKKDLERVRDLHRGGGASDQDLERSELAFNDQAVTSPVDGVVLVKSREAGEVVPAGSAVLVVGSDQDLWVKIYVPEGTVNKIKIGTEAEIKLDGIQQKLKGHVSYIAPRSEFTPRNVQTAEERVTVTFAVKVAVDEPFAQLRPGVFADVRFEI